MIKSRDSERSRGENKASEDDELRRSESWVSKTVAGGGGDATPLTHEILHHELVEGLRRVGHINLPWSISEIGL